MIVVLQLVPSQSPCARRHQNEGARGPSHLINDRPKSGL